MLACVLLRREERTCVELAKLEVLFLCSFVVLGQLGCLKGLGFKDLVIFLRSRNFNVGR
jgi:hypothetical protein